MSTKVFSRLLGTDFRGNPHPWVEQQGTTVDAVVANMRKALADDSKVYNAVEKEFEVIQVEVTRSVEVKRTVRRVVGVEVDG